MEKKYVIGLMSGTSLDGIDAALVTIEGKGESSKVNLIDFIEMPIQEELREQIKKACMPEHSNVETLCSLNFELGYHFAEAAKQVCRQASISLEEVALIGSHGQTVYHIPVGTVQSKRSTLQIGEPAVIAYETRTPVVSNFRVMDMAAGGQGAPLVPYTEFLLYRSHRNRCLQNIGGIGNVTVIPAHAKLEEVFAFDTGPGNMIMNEVMQQTKGIPYDEDGREAAKGKVDDELLKTLMAIPYIQEAPPKTTGRELFGKQFVTKLIKEHAHLLDEDLIATVTMYTASSIAYNYRHFIMPKMKIEEVIIGGGGSYNKTLMAMLQAQLPDVKVMTQEDIGYTSAAKEAIAFALLANETMEGMASNVIGATGARERVVLGNITPFYKEVMVIKR